MALIQFVDSISASPTVRLDVNDGAVWFCTNFSAPPPRLRRSVSVNAMRDGSHVSSSSYDSRTLELELHLLGEGVSDYERAASADLVASEMQKLFRELDRPSGYLMYQADSFAQPVFFRLERSDTSDLEELWTVEIARKFTVEIPAEPFALGLKETMGPFTVTNDPAAGTNPNYFDAAAVIGDVPAPVVWWDSASSAEDRRIIAAQHTPAALLSAPFTQAEVGTTLGTDTTNPGGAADAALSGTGTTNYLRTTFATNATMVSRVTWSPGDLSGNWRALAFVRRSGATSTLKVRGLRQVDGITLQTGADVTLPAVAGSRLVVDLGVFAFSDDEAKTSGYSGSVNPLVVGTLSAQASRTAGTDTLDWDTLVLFPAGGQRAETFPVSTAIVDVSGNTRALVDSVEERVAALAAAGDPTTGAASIKPSVGTMAGGFPYVVPNSGNRFHVVPLRSTVAPGESAVTRTLTVTLAYWPRYLYCRPAAS